MPERPVTPGYDYRPWDRDEKLGPVPEGGFKPDDPKVIAWEKAHGHDLRLKCYPEFGCLLLPDGETVAAELATLRVEHERLRAAVHNLLRYAGGRAALGGGLPNLPLFLVELRAALGAVSEDAENHAAERAAWQADREQHPDLAEPY